MGQYDELIKALKEMHADELKGAGEYDSVKDDMLRKGLNDEADEIQDIVNDELEHAHVLELMIAEIVKLNTGLTYGLSPGYWNEYIGQLGGLPVTKASWDYFAVKTKGLSQGSADSLWGKYSGCAIRTSILTEKQTMRMREIMASGPLQYRPDVDDSLFTFEVIKWYDRTPGNMSVEANYAVVGPQGTRPFYNKDGSMSEYWFKWPERKSTCPSTVSSGTIPMSEVKRLHKESRGFFFSQGAMQFFDSRVESDYAKVVGEYAYFITSEKGPHGPRKYHINKFNIKSNDVLPIFEDYSTLEVAKRNMDKQMGLNRAHDIGVLQMAERTGIRPTIRSALGLVRSAKTSDEVFKIKNDMQPLYMSGNISTEDWLLLDKEIAERLEQIRRKR